MGRPCLCRQKPPRIENIVSVPLCGKRPRPRWIVPGGRPERRVFSLFPTHEPHQRPRHHRTDPGQRHQSICRSSGHSGGTVFGPAVVRHLLISASHVRGSPRVCYPRINSKNPGGGHTNSWRDVFCSRVMRQSLVTAKLATWVWVRRNSMIFCRPPLLQRAFDDRLRRITYTGWYAEPSGQWL